MKQTKHRRMTALEVVGYVIGTLCHKPQEDLG